MDQTAWALLAIRTRARRAEFARLFRRPAGAHDRVVALRTRRHRRWYFMYAASEDRIMYGERYDGPGNGDGHHHRNCALEIARRARGTNRFIFSALRPRRARRRSRTPAPRPPRRHPPPPTPPPRPPPPPPPAPAAPGGGAPRRGSQTSGAAAAAVASHSSASAPTRSHTCSILLPRARACRRARAGRGYRRAVGAHDPSPRPRGLADFRGARVVPHNKLCAA